MNKHSLRQPNECLSQITIHQIFKDTNYLKLIKNQYLNESFSNASGMDILLLNTVM